MDMAGHFSKDKMISGFDGLRQCHMISSAMVNAACFFFGGGFFWLSRAFLLFDEKCRKQVSCDSMAALFQNSALQS